MEKCNILNQKKKFQEVLRTGDRDKVQFKFIRQPEYIRPGTKMVFREGRTKAVGTVSSVVPQESLAQQRAKQKDGRQKQCMWKIVLKLLMSISIFFKSENA